METDAPAAEMAKGSEDDKMSLKDKLQIMAKCLEIFK